MTILDAGLKFNSNYALRSGSVNGFVLHHAAADGSVHDVHAWHLYNGWAGIGYHFYVRKDGTVYRGRPENWVGAHTVGHNSTKIGICAEGNFDNDKMPAVQKNAIIDLLAYLRSKYGDQKIYRHRDLDATGCPGKNYPFDEIVNGSKSSNTTKVETKPVEKEETTVSIKVPMLEEGSENESVKALQRMLYAMGYDLGSKPVDGIFGSKTDAVVKDFQRKHNLDVDGIVGPDTWTALLNG